MRKVDEGNFNFPISSLPKGEGVGELKFLKSFPDSSKVFLSDVVKFVSQKNAKIKFFSDLYTKSALFRFYFLGTLIPRWVEEDKEELGYETWDYWSYKIDYFNYVSSNDYRRKRSFAEDIKYGKRNLCQIPGVPNYVLLAIIAESIVDKTADQWDFIPPDAKTVEPKDIIHSAESFQNPSSECLFVREETVFPTLSVKLEEKVEKNVVYQNQVGSLYFFYEYEIPKRYLRVFLHLEDLLYPFYEFDIGKSLFLFSYLEDLLYDLYEFNITKFLSFGEKGVM